MPNAVHNPLYEAVNEDVGAKAGDAKSPAYVSAKKDSTQDDCLLDEQDDNVRP